MTKHLTLLLFIGLAIWSCEQITIPKSQEYFNQQLQTFKSNFNNSNTLAKKSAVVQEKKKYCKVNDGLYIDNWYGKIIGAGNTFITAQYDDITYSLHLISLRDNTIYDVGQNILFSGFANSISEEVHHTKVVLDCISIINPKTENILFSPSKNELKTFISKTERRIGKDSLWRKADNNPLLKEMLLVLEKLVND